MPDGQPASPLAQLMILVAAVSIAVLAVVIVWTGVQGVSRAEQDVHDHRCRHEQIHRAEFEQHGFAYPEPHVSAPACP